MPSDGELAARLRSEQEQHEELKCEVLRLRQQMHAQAPIPSPRELQQHQPAAAATAPTPELTQEQMLKITMRSRHTQQSLQQSLRVPALSEAPPPSREDRNYFKKVFGFKPPRSYQPPPVLPAGQDTMRWCLMLMLISASSSLYAVVMDWAVELIQGVRERIGEVEEGGHFLSASPAAAGLLFVLFRMTLVGLSCAMTQALSPIAAGSGIPQMKAVLAGFNLPGALSKTTMFVKSVGCVLAIGAGLPVGREGPFIHVASCIAQWCLELKWFKHFNACPDLRNMV
jgi:hypothetical protein